MWALRILPLEYRWHAVKVDLDHPRMGTFLVLSGVKIEDLSQELMRECIVSVYVLVYVTMNPPPFKCLAFSLETRNFTAAGDGCT